MYAHVHTCRRSNTREREGADNLYGHRPVYAHIDCLGKFAGCLWEYVILQTIYKLSWITTQTRKIELGGNGHMQKGSLIKHSLIPSVHLFVGCLRICIYYKYGNL